jgi:hypothetical protein
VNHVEKEVVLLQLNQGAVIFKLCPAFGTEYNDTMILQAHAARWNEAYFLHHHQIVAVTYPIGTVAPSGLYIQYLHAVLFLLFEVQNSA